MENKTDKNLNNNPDFFKKDVDLEYVSESLRADRDILAKAVPKKVDLNSVPESLKKDRDILDKVLPKVVDLNSVPESLKKDRDILNSLLGKRAFFAPKNTTANANVEEAKESEPTIGKKRKFN